MRLAKKHIKYPLALLINVSLIAVLLIWVLHNIHLHQLVQEILHVHSSSIILVAVLDILVSMLYGLRLKYLLDSSFMCAWSSVCIGNGLNSVLPFRLGDVIRVICAKRFYNIPINTMVGATVVERCFDLFVLLFMGLTAFLIGPVPLGMTLFYIVAILFCCSVFVVLSYRMLLAGNNSFKRFICRSKLISSFLNCMSHILQKQNKKKISLLSVLIWFGLILVYAAFFEINLGSQLISWQSSMILCFITTLAFAIPYVVAGIGVFESAIIYYLLHAIHLEPTKAMALALVFHFIYSLPQVLLMAVMFLSRRRQPLSISRLFKRA